MTIQFYTLIFFFIYGAYVYSVKFLNESDAKKTNYLCITFLILISAFRWKVGGDWDAYYAISRDVNDIKLVNFKWSFVYIFINYIFNKMNLGIFGVNTLIVTIYFYSLYSLSKNLKLDFFLLTIISFTLVYFTGIMGYVRQSLALSLFCLCINFLIVKKKKLSIIFFMLSVMTHFSILIYAPFIFYNFIKKKTIILILTISILLVIFFNAPTILNVYYQFIVLESMASLGIYLRAFTLFLTVIIFITNYQKIISKSKVFNFYLKYTCGLIIFFNLFFLIYPVISSTVDRLNFFFILFQIVVIGRFCSQVIKSNNKDYLYYASFFIFLYYAILFFWLVFGDYSAYYLEYKILG